MAMRQLMFRTSKCALHGHREFTLIFKKRPPVIGLERTLLDYFENGVAKGTSFLPGQVVQLGWALLQLIERDDGTLGVQEIDIENKSGWVESVHMSLTATWFQREVVSSVGIAEPAFPRQGQNATVCDKLRDAGPDYLLGRVEPDDAEDSGWFMGCVDEEHDHRHVDNLSRAHLVGIAVRHPFVTQFLALPVGTKVRVSGPGRVRAAIFLHGEERVPIAGSYLAVLNSDLGR
jgi:hypothetical protein